ncbi:MAG: shikimate kinase [Blautia sp.]|nr:shikimate kinase [Blautia sp.]MDY3998703.1 shikimate kinase [Blautia sp.]
MNHIVIIGFMGSGKTRVGKRLAQEYGLPFIDVDRVVTKKMNLSISEIFQRFGEPYYRALETIVVKELINDKERKVVSLGSGLPVQEQNQKYLKDLGTIVYLKGSLETLKKRLEAGSNDPLLEGDDREEKIKKLLKQRDPVYAKLADIEVVTGVKPFEALIEEIKQKLDASAKKIVEKTR